MERRGRVDYGVRPSSEIPVFSFVLPACNEAANVGVLSARLVAVGEKLGKPFEVLWVDDGSTDGTDAALDALAEGDARIRVIHLSRNFGHMAALTAGLEAAEASGAVVCLDADGQHPPELIPELVARWEDGADIVQTIRLHTAHETPAKRATSRGFYRVMNLLADIDVPEGAADFRLMDRQVVDALNGLPEHVRFLRGLVHWVGYTRAYVEFEAPERLAGETKYSLFKMVRFAFNGITSFSVRPLRLSFLMALLVLAAAAVYAAFIIVCLIAGKAIAPGWTSMILLTMMLGGAQLFAIGIASEYLARMFTEQKRRPVYLVRKRRDDARP